MIKLYSIRRGDSFLHARYNKDLQSRNCSIRVEERKMVRELVLYVCILL